MMLVDSILFIVIVVCLQIIKIKYPNFMFFCKGAILFIPPEDQGVNQKSKKSKDQQQDLTIKIMKLQYNQVKQYPMKQQYQRVIFVLAALAIYLPIKILIKYLLTLLLNSQHNIMNNSSLFSLICLLLIIYVLKLGLQIIWISPYNKKICILVALGINMLFFILLLSLKNTSAVNNSLYERLLDYQKQLTIIFGKEIDSNFLGYNMTVLMILFFNVFLGLICIPAIIKFGNWYTKTLKQIYYEDQQQISDDPEIKKQKLQRQKLLKQKSMKTIRLLNIYLVACLVFLFFSHSYVQQFLASTAIDFIRVILVIVTTSINLITLKDAIEFNGSFAYKFIGQFFNSENAQQRLQLRKRIFHYISMVWYYKFQFMFRTIVPLLLFFMLIDWKYLSVSTNSLQNMPPSIMENSCGVFTSQIDILDSLTHCDYSLGEEQIANKIHQNSFPTINGILVGKNMENSLQSTQNRIIKYGLFYPGLMVEVLEILQWFFGISLYGATVLYILFIRKTVYDI